MRSSMVLRNVFTVLLALLSTGVYAVENAAATHRASPEKSAELKKRFPDLLLKGLDLSGDVAAEDLVSAGQMGGALFPTDDAIRNKDHKSSAEEKRANHAFGVAMESWNTHKYDEAAGLFKEYVKEFPNSPWVAETELHLGCESRYQGRYDEAEETYQSLLDENKSRSSHGQSRLYSKASLRMGVLKGLRGNWVESADMFRQLYSSTDNWRERTYASNSLRALSGFKVNEVALANCGFQALSYLLKEDGRAAAAREVARRAPGSASGQSVQELENVASSYGFTLAATRLDITAIKDLPLPAIVHIAGDGGDKGHYWILEKFIKSDMRLHDPQSGRRYLQSFEEFQRQWSGVALGFLQEGQVLPGEALSKVELATITGACCGQEAAASETGGGNTTGTGSDGNDPGGTVDSSSAGGGSCSAGEPIWKVNPINMNVYMEDTPLWYKPSKGPSVEIKLSYNSQSAFTYYEPFGNKWSFGYGGYLVVDPGGTVMLYMPDGRVDVYNPDGLGGYTAPAGIHNTLTRLAENHFELQFKSGYIFEYDIPAGTSSQQPFIVAVRDTNNNELTFGYDTSVRMNSITDADGNVSTLSYGANNLVSQVSDPFGRSALFSYDPSGNLISLTDMGGYATQLTYDEDVYLTSLENGSGRWEFYIEDTDDDTSIGFYPEPGTPMWENYRVTITNPQGQKEEYYYDGFYFKGWHVSPEHYVEYSEAGSNGDDSVAKTIYDYTTTADGVDRISAVYNTADPSTVTQYTYDAKGRRTSLKKGGYLVESYAYNDDGSIAQETLPNGEVISYTYHFNGAMPATVTDSLGTITYSVDAQRNVTGIMDRLGNSTQYTYDAEGRMLTMTLAGGVLLEFVYDGSGFLQTLKRDAQTLSTYTRDAVGRVLTEVNRAGVQQGFSYDNLNQITQILFDDSKTQSFQYSSARPFLLETETSRAGLIDQYIYAPNKQLSTSINKEGGRSTFEYNGDGQMSRMVMPSGDALDFTYNALGQLTQKTYADGKGSQYTYNARGSLASMVNARGQTINYAYTTSGKLSTRTDTATGEVLSYFYDAQDRVSSISDALGVTAYIYDANSNLLTADGPWANDTVTYTYDTQDRLLTMVAEGGDTLTRSYDALGRVDQLTVGSDVYSYAYTGAKQQPDTLTYPTGTVVRYGYDALARLASQENETAAGATINQFDFTFDNQDLRATEATTNVAPIADHVDETHSATYNELNQLASTTEPESTFVYDDDGNLTQGYTHEGYAFVASYDGLNRLQSLLYSDGAAVEQKTEYVYSSADVVGQIKKYADNVLQTDTRFVRHGLLPLQERDGSNALSRQYAWATDALGGIGSLLQLTQAGSKYYYLYDGKGNVSAVTDAAETSVAAYSYSPDGELKVASGSLDQPFRFSTKYLDSDTGLIDYGYRQAVPSLGRWLTRDPLGEAGGINLYQFNASNAVNFVDPNGLLSERDQVTENIRKHNAGQKTVGDLIDDLIDKAIYDAVLEARKNPPKKRKKSDPCGGGIGVRG